MNEPHPLWSLRPEFEGDLGEDRVPEDFLARFERRVRDGLFEPGNRVRADYRVIASHRGELSFAAGDFLTAYNIGLNEVELRRAGDGTLSYHVRFARWARYVRIHGALLGAGLAAMHLVPAVRAQIDARPGGEWLFWPLLVLWSAIFPWVLIGIHGTFARRALERILRSELGEAATERRAA